MSKIKRIIYEHSKYKELGVFQAYFYDLNIFMDKIEKLLNLDFNIKISFNKKELKTEDKYKLLKIYKKINLEKNYTNKELDLLIKEVFNA